MATFGALNNTTVAWTDGLGGLPGIHSSFEPFPENGTIDSAHLYFIRGAPGEGIRAGLYVGGTSDDDPENATLLYDFGHVPYASLPSSASWMTLTTTGSPAVTAGQRLWFMFAGSDAGTVQFVDGANLGDLNAGAMYNIGITGDETAALPSTIGSTGPSSYDGSLGVKVYVTYTAAGGGGGGFLNRNFWWDNL